MTGANFGPSLSRRATLAAVGASLLPLSSRKALAYGHTALPFDRPPPQLLARSGRKVFSHWWFFPLSFDNRPSQSDVYTQSYVNPHGEGDKHAAYGGFIRERPLRRPPLAGDWQVQDMAQDIRYAEAIGIDAFQVNLSAVGGGKSWVHMMDLMTASEGLGGPVQVFPCLDLTSPAFRQQPLEQMAAILSQVSRRPSMMRSPDGRFYLSSFFAEKWAADQWRALLDALRAQGTPAFFFPMFLNGGHATPEQAAEADIFSIFGGNNLQYAASFGPYAAAQHRAGRRWCEPVWPQDYRPKDGTFEEARGSQLFRTGWEQAIANEADFVDILTWNDYSEGSEIRPSSGIQYAFADLAAYYATWFKLGYKPPIVRDVMYYFHRIEAVGSPSTAQAVPAHVKTGSAADEVELLAFLTQPGRIEINLGGQVTGEEAPAGVTSLRAPLAPGRPQFSLSRGGQRQIAFQSAFDVVAGSSYQDLLYRGGSSSRPPMS